ncbi:hypothetical protein X777_03943 [Ooceraea biroi]|uniref:Uncharacterized protein n=1 Tax=Ooceraea biroi TaxID=2015173 RepID=A0A026WKY7_OOCBI|nr:hypothetical protein X777_03943 [Ooceraea biroi]
MEAYLRREGKGREGTAARALFSNTPALASDEASREGFFISKNTRQKKRCNFVFAILDARLLVFSTIRLYPHTYDVSPLRRRVGRS